MRAFCFWFGLDALFAGFDSLKYDLKSIEQVVYDISLRGLTVQGSSGAEASV